MEYKDLKIGQKFEWCGLKLVKLKDNLCIIYDLDNIKGKFCIFDAYENNYNKSLINVYINSKFLEINKLKHSEIDKVTLLSKQEYEENRRIISNAIEDTYYWWLRSPYAVNGGGACSVFNYGIIGNSIVDDTSAVRAAFILKSDTPVSLIQ